MRSLGRAYALFFVLRLALFGVALCLCLLVGLRGLTAVLVALVVSALAAIPLTRRQRAEFTRALERRPR